MNSFSKSTKLILALYPLIWVLVYFTGLLDAVSMASQLVIAGIAGFLAFAIYIREVWLNIQMSSNMKISWIVLLLLFGSFAQVAYWFTWIRTS